MFRLPYYGKHYGQVDRLDMQQETCGFIVANLLANLYSWVDATK